MTRTLKVRPPRPPREGPSHRSLALAAADDPVTWTGPAPTVGIGLDAGTARAGLGVVSWPEASGGRIRCIRAREIRTSVGQGLHGRIDEVACAVLAEARAHPGAVVAAEGWRLMKGGSRQGLETYAVEAREMWGEVYYSAGLLAAAGLPRPLVAPPGAWQDELTRALFRGRGEVPATVRGPKARTEWLVRRMVADVPEGMSDHAVDAVGIALWGVLRARAAARGRWA